MSPGKKKKRRSQESSDFSKDFKILTKAARFLLANAQEHSESKRNYIPQNNSKESESSKKKEQIKTVKKVPYTKQNNLKGQGTCLTS